MNVCNESTINSSFACNPCKQWRERRSHCLTDPAVVVFPIHALICTSHYLWFSSAGTGNGRPPTANPRGHRWPQHSVLTSITKPSLQTTYVWLMETNCFCLWKTHQYGQTGTPLKQHYSGLTAVGKLKMVKWKRWIWWEIDWQYIVMLFM